MHMFNIVPSSGYVVWNVKSMYVHGSYTLRSLSWTQLKEGLFTRYFMYVHNNVRLGI